MTETEKHKQLVWAMELLEKITILETSTHAIEALPFEELTPDLWANIQHAQSAHRHVLGFAKEGLQLGAKIIDNDAFTAHAAAVMSTP